MADQYFYFHSFFYVWNAFTNPIVVANAIASFNAQNNGAAALIATPFYKALYGDIVDGPTQILCGEGNTLDEFIPEWSTDSLTFHPVGSSTPTSFVPGYPQITDHFPGYVPPSIVAGVAGQFEADWYFVTKKAGTTTVAGGPNIPGISTGSSPGAGAPSQPPLGIIRRGTLNFKRSLTWGQGVPWAGLNSGRGIGYTYIQTAPFRPLPTSIRTSKIG